MKTRHETTIAHLSGLLEVTRLVRSGEELPAVLSAIARTIGESLGFGTVAINLYRRAWDDYVVTTVHGNPDAREKLLGDARDPAVWESLLQPRFLRRGAYFIHNGELDWNDDLNTFVPELPTSEDPDAWHPEDALFLPMLHSDGHLLGVVSVDEPSSGRRPSDEELDVLVAVAEHAALAVQSAQETAVAARHQIGLEHLLRVSSRLAETRSRDEILGTVCESIRSALAFEKVLVQLLDADSGLLVPAAQCGWPDGDAPAEPRAVSEIEPLLDPSFEQEGCFLLPREERSPRLEDDRIVYASKLNGRGPWAWNRHSLAVPLRGSDGSLAGLIWADEPQDRLLPTTERLQALRLFANQAATALASAGQFEELRFLADHDPLTRLLNRRAFMERLEAEAARTSRHGLSFSLVLCDLDGLKELNDRHGHPAGDAALRELADVLSQSLRRSDSAFRIGGDEFALLLIEARPEDAVEVVERVTLLLESGGERRPLGVAASFGAAACPRDGDTPDALFHAADEALYAAKRSGERLRFAA